MQKFILSLIIACLLGSNASATWSIIVVNRRTGEVAVASATCNPSSDLTKGLPILRIGKGAGAIQASSGGEDGLIIMFDLLDQDLDAASVLAAVLAADPSPADRQMGVVSMVGFPQTFTGRRAGQARGGVAGEFGDYAYAIQGNVLAGNAVIQAARTALISTPGDLAEKLMAAMEAARAFGGDGRCSCDRAAPTSCGSPPDSFTKSAHVGFMLIGRIGDQEAKCSRNANCADGPYFMRLNVKGLRAMIGDPDPVLQLRDLYDDWRTDRIGRPDAILSRVSGVQALPADGLSQRSFTVRLTDIDGNPLTSGGAEVLVTPAPGTAALSQISAVQDNADGSYSFSLTAGNTAGVEQLMITADDGFLKATLFPYLTLRSDAVQSMHVGYDTVSVQENPMVPFVINEPAAANRRFFMLASLNGTTPGLDFPELHLPLNRPLLHPSVGHFRGPGLSGSVGHLDHSGRADLQFQMDASLALSLVGSRLDWSALILGKGSRQATPAVGFSILP